MDFIIGFSGAIDTQAAGDQGGEPQGRMHGDDPADASAEIDQQTSSRMSQTQLWTPIKGQVWEPIDSLAKDYELLAATLVHFVTLAAIQFGIRRLARK